MTSISKMTGSVLVLLAAASCGAKPTPQGVAASAPAEAAGPPPSTSATVADAPELHWRGKTKSLEVRSINGPVHAVPSDDDQASIDAHVIKNKRHTPVRLRIVQSGEITLVCVVADSNGDDKHGRRPDRDDDDSDDDDDDRKGGHHGQGDDGCGNGGNAGDVSVELAVRVPKGSKFVGWAVNGAVEAEGLDGEVEAHTQNGAVRIDTKGIARASTVNARFAPRSAHRAGRGRSRSRA